MPGRDSATCSRWDRAAVGASICRLRVQLPVCVRCSVFGQSYALQMSSREAKGQALKCARHMLQFRRVGLQFRSNSGAVPREKLACNTFTVTHASSAHRCVAFSAVGPRLAGAAARSASFYQHYARELLVPRQCRSNRLRNNCQRGSLFLGSRRKCRWHRRCG